LKNGLIMEGGAMRGMFTAGVTDVLMENGIVFDGAIGVSAGAVFGCNYKSEQPGRVIRYNKRFCNDPRYCGLRSLITTGDFYNAEFDYVTLPHELDVFDTTAYKSNPMDFYVTVTDIRTGRAVYRNLRDGSDEDIQWMRASASMPVLSRIVELEGGLYSDGGTSDSVPVKFFQSIGYDRNVIILTQPDEYRKKKNKFLPVIKAAFRKYPEFIRAISERHVMYNETIEYIRNLEKSGEVLVIRPDSPLNIKAGEKNPDEYERVYQLGRNAAQVRLEEIKNFLNQKEQNNI